MQFNWFLSRFSNSRNAWIMIAVFFVAAFALYKWQNTLSDTVTELQREYQIDLELSQHKAEHLQVYQAIVGAAKLPQGEALSSNAWIQSTQSLVADQKLSLQELKPVGSHRKKGSKSTNLFLVAEGRVTDIIGFLYRTATANDYVYADQLTLSRSADDPDTVRAQMVLSQN